MKRQRGQVILLLILVMTVALAIGLSIVQKSLVDISTASKVEQSSRAFSAAEAGIEKVLNTNTNASCTDCQQFTDNSSTIKQIEDSALSPTVPTPGNRQAALEYPPLAKEDVAQIWLAAPSANLPTCTSPSACYSQPTLNVYWGNNNSPSSDRAALVLTLVHYNSSAGKFESRKWYLDQQIRPAPNGFEIVSTCDNNKIPENSSNSYQCIKTLGTDTALPSGMMLIRAKLLYNNTSQPFAVQAVTCPSTALSCLAYSLPAQARTITSTGISGETQRKVNVFLENKVVPHYFDYAIFSAGEISKQ